MLHKQQTFRTDSSLL